MEESINEFAIIGKNLTPGGIYRFGDSRGNFLFIIGLKFCMVMTGIGIRLLPRAFFIFQKGRVWFELELTGVSVLLEGIWVP